VIAPEALSAWDGTHAGLSTYLNWSGSGNGCFVREGDKSALEIDCFGAVTYDTELSARNGLDSAIVFNKMLSLGIACIFSKCVGVSNIQLVDNCSIFGKHYSYLARDYDTSATTTPLMVSHSSSVVNSFIINCSDVRQPTLAFFNVSCRSVSNGISGGSIRMTILCVGVRNAAEYGLGSFTSPYTRGLNSFNLVLRSAGVDNLVSVVDSHLVNSFISDAARHNVNLRAGSNSVTFAGGKIEWSGQHNITAFQCNNLTFSSVILDRAGYNGLRLNQCSIVNGNLILARSGAKAQSLSADLDTHIRLQNCSGVSLDVVTKAFGDDGGSGYTSPRHSVSFSGNGDGCSLSGDLSGCTISARQTTDNTVNVTRCTGVSLYPEGDFYRLNGLATNTSILNGKTIGTGNHYTFDVEVSAFNESTAQINISVFKLMIRRGTGSATVSFTDRVYASIGERIGTSGSSVANVSFNVNADGSEVSITVESTISNNNLIRVREVS
jgi:hypothetical protein